MDTATAAANQPNTSYNHYTEDDGGNITATELPYIRVFTPQEICVMFIYIIIIILGFIGNTLVIFAICKRRRQNVTSLLLCSLALTDLFMVIVYMPFKVADFFVFEWHLGVVMCNLVSYIALITPACSGCMLMVISLER